MNLKTLIREAYQRDPLISGEALLKQLKAPNTIVSRQTLIMVQNELRALRPGIRYTKGCEHYGTEGITVMGGHSHKLCI
jgi:hypothetical protein